MTLGLLTMTLVNKHKNSEGSLTLVVNQTFDSTIHVFQWRFKGRYKGKHTETS